MFATVPRFPALAGTVIDSPEEKLTIAVVAAGTIPASAGRSDANNRPIPAAITVAIAMVWRRRKKLNVYTRISSVMRIYAWNVCTVRRSDRR